VAELCSLRVASPSRSGRQWDQAFEESPGDRVALNCWRSRRPRRGGSTGRGRSPNHPRSRVTLPRYGACGNDKRSAEPRWGSYPPEGRCSSCVCRRSVIEPIPRADGRPGRHQLARYRPEYAPQTPAIEGVGIVLTRAAGDHGPADMALAQAEPPRRRPADELPGGPSHDRARWG
jgi:hypothetical protein